MKVLFVTLVFLFEISAKTAMADSSSNPHPICPMLKKALEKTNRELAFVSLEIANKECAFNKVALYHSACRQIKRIQREKCEARDELISRMQEICKHISIESGDPQKLCFRDPFKN